VESRKIAIITDGIAQTQELAGNIAAIIGEYQGYSTVIIPAESFSAVEILPTTVFFVGCGEPEPLSFHYIESLFKHISLAGRSCGIFSSSTKGIKYLSMLVGESDAALGKPFLAKGGAADNDKLHQWIQSIL
jgi:hypothetical protein